MTEVGAPQVAVCLPRTRRWWMAQQMDLEQELPRELQGDT